MRRDRTPVAERRRPQSACLCRKSDESVHSISHTLLTGKLDKHEDTYKHAVKGIESFAAHVCRLFVALRCDDGNKAAVHAADDAGNGAASKEPFFHGRLFLRRPREVDPLVAGPGVDDCLGHASHALADRRLRQANRLFAPYGPQSCPSRRNATRTTLVAPPTAMLIARLRAPPPLRRTATAQFPSSDESAAETGRLACQTRPRPPSFRASARADEPPPPTLAKTPPFLIPNGTGHSLVIPRCFTF